MEVLSERKVLIARELIRGWDDSIVKVYEEMVQHGLHRAGQAIRQQIFKPWEILPRNICLVRFVILLILNVLF